MTTSGTISFDLSNMDVVLEAFERAQIAPAALTRQQLVSAYRSMNLALQTWANRGTNLWAIDLQIFPTVIGQTVYSVPTDTVQILDTYYSTVTGSVTTDKIIYPISRTDYAAIANKQTGGVPNSFWFDRLSPSGQLYVWPVPIAVNTIKYYRTRRMQDADATGAQTPDIPYRFIDALVADLAARVAQKFNAKLYPLLAQVALAAWKEAADADVERTPLYLQPDFGAYYR